MNVTTGIDTNSIIPIILVSSRKKLFTAYPIYCLY